MKTMLTLSMLLNIAVLIPVCTGLMTDAAWARESYGDPSPARGILLSVYLSILLVSSLLLWIQEPRAAAALLLVQVIYKITTPFAVGTILNPVVISNLVIAGFHLVTLVVIWRKGVLPLGYPQ